jgi:hypothetical protein
MGRGEDDPERAVTATLPAAPERGATRRPYGGSPYPRVIPAEHGRPHDPGMSTGRDRCPACTRLLISTRFDATFRLPDQSERLCFGIPGGLCADCHQLYIDPDLIELLDLGAGRCTFAIESDVVLQERAWST